MAAGYKVDIHNNSAGNITIARATGADTINGATKNIVLPAQAHAKLRVNTLANGYILENAGGLVFDATDPSKQATFAASSITTGTTRTITLPNNDLNFGAATANTVLAGPTSGGAGNATMRALVNADIAGVQSSNGTVQTTTSGSAFDFTIPSFAKRVTVTMKDCSLSGTDSFLIQLGDAGGIETTGYVGVAASIPNGANPSTGSLGATTGFQIGAGGAGASLSGSLLLTLHNAGTFTWAGSGVFGNAGDTTIKTVGGYKSTSQAMTTVRLTRSGTDTFDAGEVNVLYE